jgi:hypothetical protein
MHHRPALVFAGAEFPESLDFDVVVVSVAVGAPFYRDEAVAEILEGLGRAEW